MKTLKELSQSSGLITSHIKSLVEILKSFKGSNILNVNTSIETLFYKPDFDRSENVIERTGEQLETKIYQIETNFGKYRVCVPTCCNELVIEFDKLCGIEKELPKFDYTKDFEVVATFERDVLPELKQAAKFIGIDAWREHFKYVVMEFLGGKLRIYATDAHTMYVSQWIETTCEKDIKIFIEPKYIKELKEATMLLNCVDLWAINDVRFKFDSNIKYPNINGIIFNETNEMKFEPKTFVRTLKTVKLGANKTTKKVDFHLNGSIQMSASDIDFGTEVINSIPYLSKNFPDFDISFNADYLIKAVNVFPKATELSLNVQGKADDCAVITDSVNKVYVMTVLKNCR